MRSFTIISFIGFFVVGCSSGSDDPVTVPVVADVRISSLTIDNDDDGMPEFLIEYNYDASGRIASVSQSDLIRMLDPSVTSFSYGTDGLATRDNGFEMETFFYENGRVSRIETTDRFSDGFSYTYDGSGRLSTVVGDAFFFDDDCDSAVNQGVPSYQLTYIADRLTSITGSLGDVTTLAYNPQGRLSTLTSTGACGDFTETTEATFRYGSDGLVTGSTTETSDEFNVDMPDTVELVVGYSNGLLTSVTESEFSAFGFESTSFAFAYNDQNLLQSSTVITDESSLDFTYDYEDGRCAGQRTAYPHRAVFLDLQPTFRPGDSAIACAYDLDGF